MRTGKLYDFAPILNNSIHIRTVSYTHLTLPTN